MTIFPPVLLDSNIIYEANEQMVTLFLVKKHFPLRMGLEKKDTGTD
jgi:hypothetical protein